MNFLAEAFAKHILCLFFSTNAFVCYVLIFFEKKAFVCLFSQVNYIEKSLFWPNCACDMLIFFDKSLHVLCAYFFRKKSLHVLMGPCAYKKMSVFRVFA